MKIQKPYPLSLYGPSPGWIDPSGVFGSEARCSKQLSCKIYGLLGFSASECSFTPAEESSAAPPPPGPAVSLSLLFFFPFPVVAAKRTVFFLFSSSAHGSKSRFFLCPSGLKTHTFLGGVRFRGAMQGNKPAGIGFSQRCRGSSSGSSESVALILTPPASTRLSGASATVRALG